MTTTTETTTTDRTTVIAVVRSGHYATRSLTINDVTCLVCVCGVTFPLDVTGEGRFRRHMVEMLGHRPQAIEIDRETGAMTIVCTCGDQPPMVADGTAYDLHRVHAEHPTVQPLVPEQRSDQGSDKPALSPEFFPYSVALPTWAVDVLDNAFGVRPELIIHRGGICYLSRSAVNALRSPGAMNLLGSKITDYPAGAELFVFDPWPFGPSGRFALTYRVV